MNERVKQLREALGLSQEALGARVGVTRGSISRLESGTNNVTPAMVISLCREFNVNEEWLRNGTGEMFNSLSQEEELAYIVGQALPQADDYVKEHFYSAWPSVPGIYSRRLESSKTVRRRFGRKGGINGLFK